MNKISKTIGWADYSWNPVTGCLHWKNGDCAVKDCYAKRLAEGRLRGRCGYDIHEPFKPTFHSKRLYEPVKFKWASKIFVSDMGDLFGRWVPNNWIENVLGIALSCQRHTFLFLTKNPARYLSFEFPDNCWIGTTINTQDDISTHMRNLALRDAKARIKFISFEPLYETIHIDLSPFQWIIIGGQSKPNKEADRNALNCLTIQAVDRRIPIYMKDNTEIPGRTCLRKEFPK